MYQLTKLYGNQLENLGLYTNTNALILKNPAFLRSIAVQNEHILIGELDYFSKDKVFAIADACLVEFCDKDDLGVEKQVFAFKDRKEESYVVTSPNTIGLISIHQQKEKFLVFYEEFLLDGEEMHAKNMFYDGKRLHLVYHIYDVYGIELQRDVLIDEIPTNIDTNDYKSILRFLKSFVFHVEYKKLPEYIASDSSIYQRYQRNEELQLPLIHIGAGMDDPITIGKITDMISKEENDTVRYGRISYYASLGITEEMILAKKLLGR